MMRYNTEEKARDKWCPFSRVITENKTGNRLADGSAAPGAACMASACMMWHWAGPGQEFGFCGLAGEPRTRS